MPFAMPQYAAMLQTAASMAVAQEKKKQEMENRVKLSQTSLFDGANVMGKQAEAMRMFQQLLQQQVRIGIMQIL